MLLKKQKKRKVYPFTLPGVKKKASNKKKLVGMGVGSAIVAVVAGSFVRPKDQP